MLTYWVKRGKLANDRLSPRQMRYQAALRPDWSEPLEKLAFLGNPEFTRFGTNRKYRTESRNPWE